MGKAWLSSFPFEPPKLDRSPKILDSNKLRNVAVLQIAAIVLFHYENS